MTRRKSAAPSGAGGRRGSGGVGEGPRRSIDGSRLGRFNACLADVGRLAIEAAEPGALLQGVCDRAAALDEVARVWVGVPDSAGRLRPVASAGRTAYADDPPLSIREEGPTGRGAAGRAWRGRRPEYAGALEGDADADAAAGQEEMLGGGRSGRAALPLARAGSPWALLIVDVGGERGIAADLRLLLDEVARTLTLALDRLAGRAREEELAAMQGLLLEHTHAGIALGRDRVVVLANRRLADMLGYAEAKDLVGRPTRVLYADERQYERVTALYDTLARRRTGSLADVRLLRRDGAEIIGDITMHLVSEPAGETVVWTVQDVTDRYRLERQLVAQAYHDPLTGVPNRRALDLEWPRAAKRAQRSGTATVVGIIDLDDFKAVNDAFGHEAGDRVLAEVAGRLQRQMRGSDFLARLGGDEFVVLLEGLDLPITGGQLEAALNRLHRAVEAPFGASLDRPVRLALSLGLAVFPTDGAHGEELLRRADVALYEIKAHKRERDRWWKLATESGDPSVEPESGVDAYGAAAAELLTDAGEMLRQTAAEFVDAFYGRLGRDAEAAQILGALDDEMMRALKAAQAAHVAFLFDPGTSRAALASRARQTGEVHSLVGLDSALLTRAMALYRELLTERLNATSVSARQRYRTLVVAGQRLQDDLEAELDAMQATASSYVSHLSLPLPLPGSRWVDAARAEAERLAGLAGVVAVLVLRLNADGVFTVEHSAAQNPRALEEALEGVRGAADLGGVTTLAWREGEILSTARFSDDPRFAPWQDAARQLGVRSMLAMPVLDATGQTVAGVCLYGRYPNQFESKPMTLFARSAMLRWSELWRRTALPAGAAAVPQGRARAIRERLLGDGLRMYVQPVVDLRSGQVVAVEALARLEQADGRVVGPAAFLPLLGDLDLARLFRLGLDQALASVRAWDDAGLRVGVSVNLPPSTLFLPECAEWVAQALERCAVAPGRLTLELLETASVEDPARDAAIGRLVALGVRLAIDDLGSGYSSLERLASLPFHTVKIDQGLLRRLHDAPLTALVVLDSLIQMGHGLGRDVVLEGLEDAADVEVAMALGAAYGQGFALARPMAQDRLAAWQASFALPARAGVVHTYIGALAHDWKHKHAGPLAACPVGRFLDAQGAAAEMPRVDHGAAHRGRAHAASESLTEWLVGRAVGGEGATLSPG